MLEIFLMSFSDLLNPQFYIDNGGLWLLVFIVFAETGLFAGFFLPGDSLLFVAGIYSFELVNEFIPTDNEYVALLIITVLLVIAGVIGNTVGYWFGRKSGPYLFRKKDTFFYRKKYLFQAKDFYDNNGGGAIILARFLPIIRTFAPIVAGIVGMDKAKFALYNIIGCIAWVVSMILGGHFLYAFFLKQFNFDLKSHLEIIILVIVSLTTVPVMIKLFFTKPKSSADDSPK